MAWFPVPLHNRLISTWWDCQITHLFTHLFIVSFFVSRMIEESGNKRKTMAEGKKKSGQGTFLTASHSWSRLMIHTCCFAMWNVIILAKMQFSSKFHHFPSPQSWNDIMIERECTYLVAFSWEVIKII